MDDTKRTIDTNKTIGYRLELMRAQKFFLAVEEHDRIKCPRCGWIPKDGERFTLTFDPPGVLCNSCEHHWDNSVDNP